MIAALRSVLEERGWVLTSDGSNGTFEAVPLVTSTDPMIASASASVSVRTLDALEARERATKAGWPNIPTVIVHDEEEGA